MTAHGGNHLAEGNLGADPRVELDIIAFWAPRHRRAESDEPLSFGIKNKFFWHVREYTGPEVKKMLSAAADQSSRGVGAREGPLNLA